MLIPGGQRSHLQGLSGAFPRALIQADRLATPLVAPITVSLADLLDVPLQVLLTAPLILDGRRVHAYSFDRVVHPPAPSFLPT